MEKLNERLIRQGQEVVERFIEGFFSKKAAIHKLQDLRNQCHDESTDQELFDMEQDIEEYKN